ncbi:MAG TPA: TonB-dependent receptor [Steroidobacteraceae bacterium]
MNKQLASVGLAAFAGIWACTSGAAQSDSTSRPAESATSPTEPVILQTVTVTAQRRTQNLQNVPIAVTSISGSQLAPRQITEALDIAFYVPNMIGATTTGLGSSNSYFVRALGQTNSFPTTEPQVGVYVDDIYIARENATNFSLFGVQQLQVLNGPQGTLFGRNSTGGAMLVTLRKPGREFGGEVGLSYGQFGESGGSEYRANASVDVPINEQLLTRTSAYGITSPGYARDLTTGERLNGTNNYGVREAVTLLPRGMPSLRWDVSADLEHDTAGNLLNQPSPGGDRVSYSGFSRIGGALEPYFTGAKAGFGQADIVKTFGVASNLQWRHGTGTLNFITGFRGMHQQAAIDVQVAAFGPLPTADALPMGEITLAQDLNNHQFSQEVKWNDTAWGRLNYTAGLFYLHEDSDNDFGQVLGVTPNFAVPLNDQFTHNDTKSTAIYAQGDYQVTSHLTATLGARGTDETRSVVARANVPGLGYDTAQVQAAGYPTHLESRQFTPHAALQYRFDPQYMVYASATKGFQGGGWNGLTGSNPQDFNNYGPETVWSYELGLRSTPTPRLRVNATLFYEDVKNYQLETDNLNTNSFDTTNASDMYGYGLEAQVEWRPTESLTLAANLGTIKARYYDPSSLVVAQQARCVAGIASSCDNGIVRADGRLGEPSNSAPFNLTISGSYAMHFGGLSVTPYVGINQVSRVWISTANSPGPAAPWPQAAGGYTRARTVVNASVTFGPSRLPLTITAECKNCTMVDYGTVDLLGVNYFNAPGMWDLRLNYTF